MFAEPVPTAAARAERLLQQMPVGFILWDRQWRCVGVNAEGERLCGKAASELFGRALWDLFPDVVGTSFETVYRRVAETGVSGHIEFFYPAPLNRWLDIHVCADELGVAAYYVDVTSRHQIQDRRDLAAAHDRGIARSLQEVLLPTLPRIEGISIAARYLTAVDTDQVGGDWYDVITGDDNTIRVLIGDVAGHDINAAAAMGQLRSMLRMSAWTHNDAPSQIVARLDRASQELGVGKTASLALVKIEALQAAAVAARSLELTNAGHPPPILLKPDGTSMLLVGERADLLLGVARNAPRHDHRFDFPVGSTLVLYTDGLIETRHDDYDQRITQLREALSSHYGRGSLDALLDGVIADMVGVRPDDDVAVIAVRTTS